MIDRAQWQWCGMAGHFIGGRNCRFHLCTTIGRYRISTVGDYYPQSRAGEPERRTLGIGPDSWYETCVFEIDPTPTDDEPHGEPITWSEANSERWATIEAAEAGHMAYCLTYAEKQ